MTRKLLIALGILATTTLATVPAQADSLSFAFGGPNGHFGITVGDGVHHVRHRGPGRRWDDRISVHRAERRLEHRGFRGVRFIGDRGDVYVFKAFKRHRGPVRVVVDAYSGDIVRVRGGGHRW